MVGLGNPGADYAGSLHNAGADAVELVAQRAGITLRPEKGVQARIGQASIGEHTVALAVPTTYMNDSGAAIRGLVKRFGIEDPAALLGQHRLMTLVHNRSFPARIAAARGSPSHHS